MKPPLLTKTLTLLSFVILIAGFLMYRVGKFDPFLFNDKSALQTSPNGGTITKAATDSAKTKNDSTQKLLLSSSKVLILTDKSGSILDSAKKKRRAHSVKPKEMPIMYGSKSAIIFSPSEKATRDSAKTDSSKTKRKQ